MDAIRAVLGAVISFLVGIAIHCGWIAFGVILFVIGLLVSADEV
jgi:uncharacterized membrane protein